MNILDIKNDKVIINWLDTTDENQLKQQHDEIIDLAVKNPNSEIIFSEASNGKKVINHPLVLDLLGYEEYQNITADKNLLQLLEIDNFKKVRKSLLKDEFNNIIGSTDNKERELALLEILKDIYGFSEIKSEKGREISLMLNGIKRIGRLTYGRSGDNKIPINVHLVFDCTPSDLDTFIDKNKRGNYIPYGTSAYYDWLVCHDDFALRMAPATVCYGLEFLVKDPEDSIREEVAHQGYGLNILINDHSPVVKAAVENYLKEFHYSSIDDWKRAEPKKIAR